MMAAIKDWLMNKSNRVIRYEIAKLDLVEGDTLVISTDMILSVDQVVLLKNSIAPYVPQGVKVMVLTSGMKLSVLRDKRAA